MKKAKSQKNIGTKNRVTRCKTGSTPLAVCIDASRASELIASKDTPLPVDVEGVMELERLADWSIPA